MNVQTLILSDAAHPLLPFAQKKIAELEAYRVRERLPLIHKTYLINDIYILIKTSGVYHKIIMWGGDIIAHLMFSSPDNSTTITTYNYLTDKLQKLATFDEEIAGEIHPYANGTCHLEETHTVTYPSKAKGALESGTGLTYLGVVPPYEMEFLTDLTDVYARHATGFGVIAKPLVGHTFVPEHCRQFKALFGMTSYPMGALWNLWQGLTLSFISPATAAVGESWVWIPSFYTMHPAEGVPPGWYYGYKGYSQYDQFSPLTSAKVSLLTTLETKDATVETQTGWVEMVTEVDGVPDGSIFAYLENMTISGNGYNYRELVTGDYNKSVITIGSDLNGFAPAIKLAASVAGVKPDKVDFWNFRGWIDEDALIPQSRDGCALLVVEGARCRGIRYRGFQTTFVDTEKYHSHAVSSYGQYLALFEFADDAPTLIASVKIYDLFGARETLLVPEEEATYLLGGFSLLRESTKVASISPQSGCFIPLRAKGFVPLAPAFDPATYAAVAFDPGTDNNIRNFLPALATMRFIKDANEGLTITKLFCENGVDAELVTATNECFGSTIVVDDPRAVTETDKLVASWDEGNAFRGKVRGSFTRSGEDITFTGESAGTLSGWYGVMQLRPTFSITRDSLGDVYFGDHAGALTYGSCLDENGAYDEDNCTSADCDAYAHIMTASSSCGQSGSGLVTATPITIAAGNFNADGTVKVGSTFTAIGGVGSTFSFSLPTLSFTVSGRVATVTGIGSCGTAGTPAWRTATVSDVCVTSDGYDYRLPNGRWGPSILIFSCTYPGGGVPANQTPPLCRCSTGVICHGIKISGGMRTSESFRWLSAAMLAAGKASPYNCQLPSPTADTFTDSCGTATSPSASAYCDDGCANPIKAYVFNRSIQEWIC